MILSNKANWLSWFVQVDLVKLGLASSADLITSNSSIQKASARDLDIKLPLGPVMYVNAQT